MTTGNTSRPGNIVIPDWIALNPSVDTCQMLSYVTSPGPETWFGLKEYRIWSGADRPKTPPIWDRYYYTLPTLKGRRRFSVKQRRISPGSDPFRKEEDHAYTLSSSLIRAVLCTNKHYQSKQCFNGPPNNDYRKITYLSQIQVFNPRVRFGPGNWSNTAFTSNDDIALLGRLRSAVAGSDFDATVFLGEGRESLHLIFDTATKIRKSLTQLRRGNVLKAAKELGLLPPGAKRVPSVRHQTTGQGPKYVPVQIPKTPNSVPMSAEASRIWLEWSYGWIPLVKDVASAAEFLAKHLEAPMYKEYRVSLKKNASYTPSQPYVRVTAKGYTRKSILARLTEVNSVRLAGFTDPAAVAWELVPWSFVVDWFIPIGNYLQARGLDQSLRGTYVTTAVTKKYAKCEGRQPSYNAPGEIGQTFEELFWSESTVDMTRTVSNSLQVPTPSFKSLGDVPSWKRALNAVSLLTLQFGNSGLSGLSRRNGLY